MNLRKVKWLVICCYNPHKNYISNHLENLSKALNGSLSQYEKFLCIGDFQFAMNSFCDIYHLKNLANVPTCYKNPLKPSCIDLFLIKLLTQFPRYSGNRNWTSRFSQDEYNSLENAF